MQNTQSLLSDILSHIFFVFVSDSVITKIHILIKLCKIPTSAALNISVNISAHLPTAIQQTLTGN